MSLAHALDKIEAYRFTPMLSETTRAYFTGARRRWSKGALGEAMRAWLANPNDGAAADVIEASESEVGLTRTRCVADAAVCAAMPTMRCRSWPRR